MKAITRRSAFVTAAVCAALLVVPGVAQTPAKKVTALVGGTLIDGYGGRPLPNSVVVVEGERISAVGTVATLPVPRGAEVISTEGMSVLPSL
jgi:imidazolonepropionase-like amidohydrolase